MPNSLNFHYFASKCQVITLTSRFLLLIQASFWLLLALSHSQKEFCHIAILDRTFWLVPLA